ncbi:MAG: DUF2341 domain-containing protein, partial [Chitinivibrionales bacterium]|nr:DUF2341 domain-containing protein [Chitinivibrionales bacterium]
MIKGIWPMVLCMSIISLLLSDEVAAQTEYNVGYGYTYSTIQQAIDSIPANLYGQGEQIVVVHRKAGSAPWVYDENINISSGDHYNASSSDRIRITVDEDDRHDGTSSSGIILDGKINISVNHSVIEWLEIRNSNAEAAIGCAAGSIMLKYLLLHDNNHQDGVGIEAAVNNPNVTIQNCIIYNMNKHAVQSANNAVISIENSTIYNCGDCGIDIRDGSTGHVQNVISMNCTVQDFRNWRATWGTIRNNMSSDNTAPGTNCLYNKTASNQFISLTSGSENFHLKANSSAIDSGYTIINSIDDDIDDQLRPIGNAWDIGADEYGVSSGDPYENWAYSKTLYLNTTSSGANVSQDINNFPVLIRLNASNFNFLQAKGNGDDIRFSKSDNQTAISYEIERWDSANQVAEIWVKIDTVFGNSNIQNFEMYWGNASASSQSNGAAVFSSSYDYEGVWHLDEDGSAQRADATG